MKIYLIIYNIELPPIKFTRSDFTLHLITPVLKINYFNKNYFLSDR